MAMTKDPAFIAEAKKMSLDLSQSMAWRCAR